MTDPAPTEIDQLFWFPTKVTELIQAGVTDVVPKTVALLPEYQRNRVLRDLELSINRELKTLSEAEQKAVETQMDTLQKKKIVMLAYNEYQRLPYAYDIFTSEHKAAQCLLHLSQRKCLYKWNKTAPKTLINPSFEECLKLVQNEDEIQNDSDGDIIVTHQECDCT